MESLGTGTKAQHKMAAGSPFFGANVYTRLISIYARVYAIYGDTELEDRVPWRES